MFLPNARKIAGESAGAYTSGPYRLVLHTTEGTSVAGAIAAFRLTRSWPHFTIDPATKEIVQHLDTAVAARALQNLSGGVETNRHSAIQVEIVGKAATGFTVAQLEWLGQTLKPVLLGHKITTKSPIFAGSEAYGVNSSTRMSFAEWNSFNGVCGHQHVPENNHWDPGKIDIDAFKRGVGLQVEYAPASKAILVVQGDGKVRVDIEMHTDGNGNGWTLLAQPFSTFEAATVHGPYPPVDGYWDAPVVAVQERGGKTIVTVTEGPKNSVVGVHVLFSS